MRLPPRQLRMLAALEATPTLNPAEAFRHPSIAERILDSLVKRGWATKGEPMMRGPMEATCYATYAITPAGEATLRLWLLPLQTGYSSSGSA